ncbi:MAG: hypothetical protein R3C44_14285, partial [Chloroflexota bacterium]
MLRFSDFSHLPEVDRVLADLLRDPSGLTVVTGPDGRPVSDMTPTHHFLPSGRQTIFRILISELLDAHPKMRCVIIAKDRDVFHTARRFRHRLEFIQVNSTMTYEAALAEVAPRSNTLV